MRRGKLLMITLAVIAAGVAAALPYQMPDSGGEVADSAAENPLPLHAERAAGRHDKLVALSLSGGEEAAGASPAAEFLQAAKQQSEPTLEIPVIRRDETLRSEMVEPDLSPMFRPFTETIRQLREVEAARGRQPRHELAALPRDDRRLADDSLTPEPSPDDTGGASDDRPAQPPAGESPAEPSRRHRVVDGDTLESIAQRYYGDPSLAGWLFEANRAVLERPQLLPLGAELEIPASNATRAEGEMRPVGSPAPSRRGILGAPQVLSEAL